MGGLTIETKLRPCWVINVPTKRGQKQSKTKALFHCWDFISNVVDASPLIGGHPGGVIAYTVGIVEFEDGSITMVSPQSIQFVSGIFGEYSWGDTE